MDTSGIEGLFFCMIVIVVVLLIVGVIIGAVFGVTCFWRETTLDEVVDVEVVDKSMPTGGSSNYYILVKGITSDGETYCEEHYVSKEVYADLQSGDILKLEIKKTFQPIFGEDVNTKLIFT